MQKKRHNWVIWFLLIILILTMSLGSYYIQNVQSKRVAQQTAMQNHTVAKARKTLQQAGFSTKHLSDVAIQKMIKQANQNKESLKTYAEQHANLFAK